VQRFFTKSQPQVARVSFFVEQRQQNAQKRHLCMSLYMQGMNLLNGANQAFGIFFFCIELMKLLEVIFPHSLAQVFILSK
jgi:hypothetical protein